MHQQETSPAAVAYAQAVFELAVDANQAEVIGQELNSLRDVIQRDPAFQEFFANPTIRPAERWDAVQRSFAGQVSPLLMNFLGVLNAKNRFVLMPEIAEAYRQMLDKQQNRVRVQVTVAKPLDEQQANEVQQRVSKALGKNAILEQKVDDSIIGGLVLRVQDKVIDGSVKAQLDALRKQIKIAHV